MKQYYPRQVAPLIFREDTGIAVCSRGELIARGERVGDRVCVVENRDENASIDIHDEEDFVRAEMTLKRAIQSGECPYVHF